MLVLGLLSRKNLSLIVFWGFLMTLLDTRILEL
jgi:hypothetical protein